jgi:hypothetical protein
MIIVKKTMRPNILKQGELIQFCPSLCTTPASGLRYKGLMTDTGLGGPRSTFGPEIWLAKFPFFSSWLRIVGYS